MLHIRNYNLSLMLNDHELPVLISIDMDIAEGEIVGLIGESGSGKSVFWKSILGLMAQKKWHGNGNVILNQKDLLHSSPSDLAGCRGTDVAVILQDPMNAFDQLFTIEQHFIETARAHTSWSRSQIVEKAVALLRRLYIREPEKVIKMYPFQCSGGMLQRVMIAIAMMMETPLIIADEPTTAVDITVQREIISMLKEINKENHTSILFISHDLKIIESLADRVYVMYAGSIVENFPSKVLASGNALHPYSQKLLQARPSYTRDYLSTMNGNPPSILDRPSGCPFAPRCEYADAQCKEYDMRSKSVGVLHNLRCCKVEVSDDID